MPITGGAPTQITSDADEEVQPTWAPDGRRLAFSRKNGRTGSWEIWIVDVTEPGVRTFVCEGFLPRWSPVASQDTLLFQRARQRGSRLYGVWTIDLVRGEGRNPTEVVSAKNAAILQPNWSPDGAQIVFTTVVNPDGGGEWPEQSDIWIVNADGTDRVVVVMSKVCLGSTWLEFETVGYALAEFVYDPNDPPADRAITGEVTQPDLASVETGYGRALMLLPDGFLYGYHCGEFPDSWGPCQVGRVVTGEVAETASWRYWNGDDWTDPDSWVPDRSDAGAMDVPGAEVNTLPVAAFGVVRDDRHDAYLMVYSPWPAFCSELAVRVADTPVGPWSEPVPITLPGCRQEVAGLAQHCYAATPQMQLCGADEFGGGYFDLKTDAGIGQYLAFVAPFIVVRSEP